MARWKSSDSKGKKKKASGRGKRSSQVTYRSAISGRYVTKSHAKRSPGTTTEQNKGVSSEAKEFSRWFDEEYRETLRELSKS